MGKNITWENSNLTNHNLNYIKFKQLNKNLSQDDKQNPQARLPVLNWHHQNPNITTVEMLIVLLRGLYIKVRGSEFIHLWQH